MNIKDYGKIKINEVFEHEGQKYLKMSESKALKVARIDENGKPVIEPTSEETLHPDGRKDVKIFVPMVQIQGENKL
ncbi:MAG: hypothetical protein PHQ35_10820 [Phycisphaerae bacterium]|nr:hypothetical protein [Phycisphaerae bacterium]